MVGSTAASSVATVPPSQQFSEVNSLLLNIMGELQTMGEIFDTGLPAPDQITRNFREMKVKLDHLFRIHREQEEQSRLLDARVEKFEQQLVAEQRHRSVAESKLELLWRAYQQQQPPSGAGQP